MKILGISIGHSKPGPQRTQTKPGPRGGVGARIPVHHQPGQGNVNGRTFTHTTPYHQSKVPNPVHHVSQTKPMNLKKGIEDKLEKIDLREIRETRPDVVKDLIALIKGQVANCSYKTPDGNLEMFVTDSDLIRQDEKSI